jgi:hypothetical protein
VADVDDRPVFSAPGDEKLCYATFRIWIISWAIDRVIGRIDGLCTSIMSNAAVLNFDTRILL